MSGRARTPAVVGLVLLPLAWACLSACRTVEPWERAALAAPRMQSEPNGPHATFVDHVRQSREAIAPGSGSRGGAVVVTRAFRAWLRTLGPARPARRVLRREQPSGSLRALTTAALALPGLAASFGPILWPALAPATAAAGSKDEIRLQYGRYEEDERRLPGVVSRFDPIDVDYLSLGSTVGLLDRWNLSLDFIQDTWSGATPVASAPQSLFGNRASAPDGVSGATPFIAGDLYFDGDFQVLQSDLFGGLTGRKDPGLVHTLSSASPETRKEVDLGVEYEWDDAEISGSGGASVEPDYLSGFARIAARLDFDQKRTRVDLSAGFSQTRSTLTSTTTPCPTSTSRPTPARSTIAPRASPSCVTAARIGRSQRV